MLTITKGIFINQSYRHRLMKSLFKNLEMTFGIPNKILGTKLGIQYSTY